MTLTDLHEPNKLIRMHYPGPYGFQAGIDGLDHTYEILCQFTQTCLASVRYWNDGRRAKARATRIVDALNDFGLAPATLKVIRGDDVPRYMGAKKVSMHQAGFQEVLSSAQLSGDFPRELALVGVQPELLDDYGGSLTDGVRRQIDPAIDIARQILCEWGFAPGRRPQPLSADELTSPGALDMADYESGRPVIEGQTR